MFEVVVVGGGPAGVTAALRARELGLVATSPRWGTPERTDAVEWEHSGGKT